MVCISAFPWRSRADFTTEWLCAAYWPLSTGCGGFLLQALSDAFVPVIQETLRRGSIRKADAAGLDSTAPRENRHQLLRRNHFELSIGAVGGFLVEAPSPKM